jgi:hypothetical protein
MAQALTLALAMAAIAVRALVGLVFIQAAVGKVRHWPILEGVISNYRILPDALARPAAALLPPIEFGLGAALMLWAGAPVLGAAAGMLAIFAAAMGVNLLRGRSEIDCGCFQSDLRQQLSWPLVARNLVLAGLLVLPALTGGERLGAWLQVEAYGAGAVLFLLYRSLDVLAATGPRLRTWSAALEAAP